MHPCEIIYNLHGNGFQYGKIKGICRITGKESTGMPFQKWVKDTFTDHAYLHPGTIISNAAAFCFEEASEVIKERTGRDKPQRFRTYSHVVMQDGMWHTVTKADKQKIVGLLQESPQIVCLTDSGQKHVFFKHKPGFWQLDESFVLPDLRDFNFLHGVMMDLLGMGFSQAEIISGKYIHDRILKVGIETWQTIESKLELRRGEPIFDFTGWLMYSIKPIL